MTAPARARASTPPWASVPSTIESPASDVAALLAPERIGPHDGAGKTCVVAMSGGVDSAVTALIMRERGYRVVGINLRLFSPDDPDHRANPCCGIPAMDDARMTCARIGVPFYAINMEGEFGEAVVQPFRRRVRRGAHPESLPGVQPARQVPPPGGAREADRRRLPGHRALCPDRARRSRDGGAAPPAARGRPEKGPELRPLHADPRAARLHPFPARWAAQDRDAGAGAGFRPAGGGEGGESGDLLRRQAFLCRLRGRAAARRDPPRRDRRHRRARRSASTEGWSTIRSGSGADSASPPGSRSS